MNVLIARGLAERSLAAQRDRSGGALIEHVARVAAAVPPEARVVAWLHELLERADATEDGLRRAGAEETEVAAVRLLTRQEDVPYDAYTLALAFAPGRAGRLARTVKLADLDDHLAHVPPSSDAPPYAWARRHIALAEDGLDRALRQRGGRVSAGGAVGAAGTRAPEDGPGGR